MIVIGLSGKIGVGKTSIADELEELFNRAGRISFGDALKFEAADEYGFDSDLAYFPEGKNEIVYSDKLVGGQATVRQILQAYGAEKRRHDPDYWTDKVRTYLAHLDENHDAVIIDDVRFPDEVALIREEGGFLVRVEPYPGWKPGRNAHDESETALDNAIGWDLVVRPAYGPDALHLAACKIIGKMEND